LVTQNFRGPGDRLRQFLGVCLFSRDKVCHNERTPGNPNIQIPEGARPLSTALPFLSSASIRFYLRHLDAALAILKAPKAPDPLSFFECAPERVQRRPHPPYWISTALLVAESAWPSVSRTTRRTT
jgi:hypothetical protein